VHVSIGDTGIGIDPSNVDRMFKSLFTTKDGMGDGSVDLPFVVERRNGRIWVSAADGGGTIFQLILSTIGRRT